MQSAFKERLNRSNPVWMNFGPDEGDEKSVEWIAEEMVKKWVWNQ